MSSFIIRVNTNTATTIKLKFTGGSGRLIDGVSGEEYKIPEDTVDGEMLVAATEIGLRTFSFEGEYSDIVVSGFGISGAWAHDVINPDEIYYILEGAAYEEDPLVYGLQVPVCNRYGSCFLSEVVTSIDYADLVAEVGLDGVGTLNEENTWIKLILNGQAMLFPKYPVITGISYKELYEKGLVYGVTGNGMFPIGGGTPQEKTIHINGIEYTVRLPRASNLRSMIVPLVGEDEESYQKSELAKLLYPIVVGDKTYDGEQLHEYTDSDLKLLSSEGDGALFWCQESYSGDSRIVVGGNGVTTTGFLNYETESDIVSWRPLLAEKLPPVPSLIAEFSFTLSSTDVEMYLQSPRNILVDWGDGNQEVFPDSTGVLKHKYIGAGVRELKLYGQVDELYLASYDLIKIKEWDGLDARKISFFNEMGGNAHLPLRSQQLREVPNKLPETISSLNGMFRGCSLFNGDISDWDTSQVTDMSFCFYQASSLNKNLNWETGNVYSFDHMFNSALSFNGDIRNWDVSAALSMDGMFSNAGSFNRDLSGWDVSRIGVEPEDFDKDAYSWVNPDHKPKWGFIHNNCTPSGICFHGEVEFMSYASFANALSIYDTINTNAMDKWIEVTLHGKRTLIPKEPITFGTSWDKLYLAGLVYGEDGYGQFEGSASTNQETYIEDNGRKYLVRLPTATDYNPSNVSMSGGVELYGTMDSETSKIFYPLIGKNPLGSYTGNLIANYSNDDLGFDSGEKQFGYLTLSMNTNDLDSNAKYVVGGQSVGEISTVDFQSTDFSIGWRPLVIDTGNCNDGGICLMGEYEVVEYEVFADAIGLPNENVIKGKQSVWISLKIDNQDILIPRTPICYGFSIQELYELGLVFDTPDFGEVVGDQPTIQGKIVRLNGNYYRLGLMSGTDSSPSNVPFGFDPEGSRNSSYSRILYSLLAEENTPPSYTFSSLGNYASIDFGIDAGEKGSYTLTKSFNEYGDFAVRGGYSVEHLTYFDINNKDDSLGYRPKLTQVYFEDGDAPSDAIVIS